MKGEKPDFPDNVRPKAERKPVFCAHPGIYKHDVTYDLKPAKQCLLCNCIWTSEDEPKSIIGYVEAVEDGGSK